MKTASEVPVIDELFTALVTLAILFTSAIAHPTRAHCPGSTWWLSTGIRTTGKFCCVPAVIGGDDDVLTGKNTSVQPPGTLCGQIYCTGGTLPIVRNYRTIGCQRGRSS